jgi:o-succinylbenzoate---CoA ligase
MGKVPNPLQSTALARPEHIVLVTDDRKLSAKGLVHAVAKRAAWFQSQGLNADEIVALSGQNTLEWLLSFHALQWLGAVVAPLPSPEKQSQAEFDQALTTINPVALLWVGESPPQNQSIPVLGPMADDCDLPGLAERFWELTEPRLIVLSSGSTGHPKRIALSCQQLLLSAFGSNIRLGHELSDCWLACLPLHHVGGLSILFRCAWNGTTVHFQPKFHPKSAWQALQGGSVTLVSLVPAMLREILAFFDEETRFPPALRAILLGGAPCPTSLLEKCKKHHAPIALTWGMTEAASQIATRFAGDLSENAGSGPAVPFARVEARAGRLLVSGPLIQGQSLVSSDLGYVDSLGRVHVSGRADQMIVSGGENISLVEIEQVICRHPGVSDVVVLDVDDEEWGQRAAAFIVRNDSCDSISADEVKSWCRESLAPFKTPKFVVCVTEFPRSSLGKVQKPKLREFLPKSCYLPKS